MVVKYLHVLVPMRCPRVVPTDVVYTYQFNFAAALAEQYRQRSPWPDWSARRPGLATRLRDRLILNLPFIRVLITKYF